MSAYSIILLYATFIFGLANGLTCPSGYVGFLADPADCSRYYQCWWGQTYSFNCPAGTLWSAQRQYCDWSYNVQCTSAPTTTAAPPPPPTTTAAPPPPPTTTTAAPPGVGGGSSASCQNHVTVTSSWSGNFGAKFSIPVKNSITSYTITVTTDIPLTNFQLWNADVTPNAGSSFTITPKSWFSGLSAGSILELGFQVAFQGSTQPTFTSIIFNDGTQGTDVCSSSGGTSGPVTNAPTQAPTAAPTTEGPIIFPTNSPTVAPTQSPTTGSSTANSGKKVVCYFPNWPYYRPGEGKYFVENIDPTICTHIIYSFAILDGSTYTMKPHDAWLDIDLKGYEKFIALKKQYPNKKFLIAIGGWNDSRTNKYSTMLADPSKRARFVSEAVNFLQQYGFDGLDLDYEYPAFQQSASEKQTFAAWCRELKTAFQPYGYELTAAVAAGKDKVDAGYDVPEISKYLDAIHIMSYDLHGSWETTVNHHAPMTSSVPGDYLTVDFAVKYWLQSGCPPEKLVVGIPTYGRTFTLSSTNTGLGSGASGAGQAGSITGEAGFLSYQEICLKLAEGGWTVDKVTDGSRGPIAYKGNQWVGYDDKETARQKAQYVLDNGLGGAMFWDLPSDDFSNRCGGGTYPIIRTVYQTLYP